MLESVFREIGKYGLVIGQAFISDQNINQTI